MSCTTQVCVRLILLFGLPAVSQLTKQLMTLEAGNRGSEEALLELRKQHELLRSKCNDLKADVDGRVAAEEHVAMVNELKR